MDTLKGNLELFGLEAIAGLLSSARKTGALRVAVDGLNGRLFFVDGALVYATTRKHDGSVNDLRGRGTEIRDRRRIWSLSLPELLRHQITDVLVRILRRHGGEFVFDENVTTTALPSGRTLSFNPAEMILRAQERLEQWREIEGAIPDSSVKYRLAGDLPPDVFEVTVDARTWTFLSAVGDGVSAGDIAERLRIFEFPAAQKMAEFVGRGLLVPVDAQAAATALREARAARAHIALDEGRALDTGEEASGLDVAEPSDVVVTIVSASGDGAVAAGSDEAQLTSDVRSSDAVVETIDEPEMLGDSAPAPHDDEPPPLMTETPLPTFPGSFDAETASHALAEWGETSQAESHATVHTQATTEVITDVGREPSSVGADHVAAPWSEVADPAGVDGDSGEDTDGTPQMDALVAEPDGLVVDAGSSDTPDEPPTATSEMSAEGDVPGPQSEETSAHGAAADATRELESDGPELPNGAHRGPAPIPEVPAPPPWEFGGFRRSSVE